MPDTARPRTSVLIAACVAAVALFALVVLIEFVLSVGFHQYQRSQSSNQTIDAELTQEPYRGTDWGRAYWEEISEYKEKWEPYFVYRVGTMRGRFINVTDGVRATYQPTVATERRRPLVFVFGGSAAWGHGARDSETLPSWLARVAEERGTPLEVRNYAESGWVNWQGIAYLLRKLAEGERPDLVIFDAGVNEVLSGRQWPQVWRPIWDADLYPTALNDWTEKTVDPLGSAWNYYRSTSVIMGALSPPPSSSTKSTGPSPRPVRLAGKIASEYRTDVSVVEALGREYGFSTLFVWQPTVAAKKTLSAQERTYAGWLPWASDAMPALEWWAMSKDLKDLYEEVGYQVVGRDNIIELTDAFDGMTTSAFIDWMHPSGPGNERIARALYARLPSHLNTGTATN